MLKRKSDFQIWRTMMRGTIKTVEAAGEAIGIRSLTKLSALNTGAQELSVTERLAMSAVRAGLPPWTPEADERIDLLGSVASFIDGQASGKARSSNAA